MTIKRYGVDDWEGYYINGKLVAQGHSVTVEEILNILGHELVSRFQDSDLNEFGFQMPINESDIKQHFENIK